MENFVNLFFFFSLFHSLSAVIPRLPDVIPNRVKDGKLPQSDTELRKILAVHPLFGLLPHDTKDVPLTGDRETVAVSCQENVLESSWVCVVMFCKKETKLIRITTLRVGQVWGQVSGIVIFKGNQVKIVHGQSCQVLLSRAAKSGVVGKCHALFFSESTYIHDGTLEYKIVNGSQRKRWQLKQREQRRQ